MEGTPEVGTHATQDRLREIEARVGQVRSVSPTPGEPITVEMSDSIILVDGSAYGPLVQVVPEITRLTSPTTQFTLTIGDEETDPISAAPADFPNQFFVWVDEITAALEALPNVGFPFVSPPDVNGLPGVVDISISEDHPDMELTGSPTGGSIETTQQGVAEVPEQPLVVRFPESPFVPGQQLTVVVSAINEEAGASGVYFEAVGQGELLGYMADEALQGLGASVIAMHLGDGRWTTLSWENN